MAVIKPTTPVRPSTALNRPIKKEKKSFGDLIKRIFFSSQGFPIFLTGSVIAILFVLFRMKAVELDYDMIEIKDKTNDIQVESKQLDAEKARLLAVDRLRLLAKKYELHPPQQEQIIVIP